MHPRIAAVLASAALPYIVHRHADQPIPITSPRDFAAALDYSIKRITKTLLLQDPHGDRFGLVVSGAARRINFSLIAAQLGCRRMTLASRETLQRVLDYPPTSVAPLGAGQLPIFLDQALLVWPTVLIGAGELGVEIELSPAQLRDVTDAMVLPLTL